MKKFKSFFPIILVAMVAMLGYCGSSKETVKETPPAQPETPKVETAGAEAAAKTVAELNKQLAKLTLKNFPVGKGEVPTEQYEKWAKASATVISGALKNMPSGYVLQLTGHADPRGEEGYNDNLSLERAQFVKAQLAKQGISSPNITVKGEGERKLANTADPNSGDNRRVEFIIIKQ